MWQLRAGSILAGLLVTTITMAAGVRAERPGPSTPAEKNAEAAPEVVERGEPADPNQTGFEVPPDATPESLLQELVPDRSDSPADWFAPVERLYQCGEPRILCPLVPPPPCHPVHPPAPYDLVGVPGSPSSGPLYEGPCRPRAGSRDHCRWPTLRRLHDGFVDHFYSPNYWPK
jgi:hypothetical protein